jgi:hypothetical protein
MLHKATSAWFGPVCVVRDGRGWLASAPGAPDVTSVRARWQWLAVRRMAARLEFSGDEHVERPGVLVRVRGRLGSGSGERRWS